jgi:hypothetical protein
MWDTVAYPFDKGRLFLIGAIGLALPVTLWAAVHYAVEGRVGDSVFLAVVSLPLLLLDVWVWRRLLSSHPALVFHPDALIEQASLFGAGRIERTEIAAVRTGSSGGWRMVYLDVHRPSKRRMTPAIPAVLVGMSAQALADEIERWWKAGQRR